MNSPEPQPRSSVPFSFELYPPRSAETGTRLEETIRRLAEVGPRFISVTYGAGGTSQRSSIDVLGYIRDHTEVEPLAHLTCVGSTAEHAHRVIREFLDEGSRASSPSVETRLRACRPMRRNSETLPVLRNSCN